MLHGEYDAVARGSAALIVLNLSRLSTITPAGIEVLLRINAREDSASRGCASSTARGPSRER